MGSAIHIVMDDEWASRYRPLTFTLPADSALMGTVNSIKQGRTSEGYFLASDVEFSPEGIRFMLTGGELSFVFVPADWGQAWQASFTPPQKFKGSEVTDDWLTFMFGYRVFDGKRGREKIRATKDYLVNTVHGLRYLHEQEEGEDLSLDGAVQQVIEALSEGKDGSHFPDDAPLLWPEKWGTSDAFLKEVSRDRKEAVNLRGWTIKRGRPKGKKSDE